MLNVKLSDFSGEIMIYLKVKFVSLHMVIISTPCSYFKFVQVCARRFDELTYFLTQDCISTISVIVFYS